MARAALAPQHIFQILTKRSARMRAYMNDPETPGRIHKELMAWGGSSAKDAGRRAQAAWRLEDWPLANVWAGVSVEDQPNAHRLDDLVETIAAVRWVSAEPLLGEVDFTAWLDRIHWVVVGGESDKGPRARPMHPDWPLALLRQCEAAGVPFLFKQHGDWAPYVAVGGVGWHNATPQRESYKGPTMGVILVPGGEYQGGKAFRTEFMKEGQAIVLHLGKERAGRLLNGRTYDGLPA
jgi:protein gp37